MLIAHDELDLEVGTVRFAGRWTCRPQRAAKHRPNMARRASTAGIGVGPGQKDRVTGHCSAQQPD